MGERHTHTNRLVNEKSPYLLQHAHNPVDWYPWGEEAFNHAKEQDKPIFLSIGYATCHWCHTMEAESFENLEIAELLNDTFINIKIDREELPEVDNLYMEFAQSMMTGAAGWPLNVILTPELEPFFATTYLPPYPSQGMMGLTDLITRIREVWFGHEKEHVIEQASKIVGVFMQSIHVKGEQIPDRELILNTSEMLFKMADSVYGGIKGAPKFPIGYQGKFLLHHYSSSKDSRALFLVERTLDMMQRGGIYDHLGGGFARYSVDEKWYIPHFEKMLYDNALLAQVYLSLWVIDQSDFYREITEEVLDYVLHDMTHPEGGFYSAQDADSEGVEGKFYTWTKKEIEEALGQEESQSFCSLYNVTEVGNFEGRNVLFLKDRVEEFAVKNGIEAQLLEEQLIEQKKKLFEIREKRERPFKDDKILCAWNGLMISAMAEAGFAFQNPRYIEAARSSARFIKDNMWKDGQLFRRWRDGEAKFNAGLDEYAFLIKGLLSLYEAGCGTEWLHWSVELTNILWNQFKVQDGAFYQSDGMDPYLILRKCQFADGAEPSGNAIHCENLLKLYQITWEPHYWKQAEDILKAAKSYIDTYPLGYSYHMMNLNRYYDESSPTIVVAFNNDREHEKELIHLLSKQFIPHKVVIWRDPSDEVLFNLIPFSREQVPLDGKTTLYICKQKVCQKPLTEFTEMTEVIRSL